MKNTFVIVGIAFLLSIPGWTFGQLIHLPNSFTKNARFSLTFNSGYGNEGAGRKFSNYDIDYYQNPNIPFVPVGDFHGYGVMQAYGLNESGFRTRKLAHQFNQNNDKRQYYRYDASYSSYSNFFFGPTPPIMPGINLEYLVNKRITIGGSAGLRRQNQGYRFQNRETISENNGWTSYVSEQEYEISQRYFYLGPRGLVSLFPQKSWFNLYACAGLQFEVGSGEISMTSQDGYIQVDSINWTVKQDWSDSRGGMSYGHHTRSFVTGSLGASIELIKGVTLISEYNGYLTIYGGGPFYHAPTLNSISAGVRFSLGE